MALLGTSLVWDVIGIWRAEPLWWAISYWNVVLGLALAVVAATAGAVDYAAIEQDHPALATGIRHMLYMLGAIGVYTISLVVRGGTAPPTGTSRIAVLFIEGVGLVLLSVGGWYGGHLVFRYGIGRDEVEGVSGTTAQPRSRSSGLRYGASDKGLK
ncbi:MAG TPA: DUF2231 domain-containing protein, partial [Blastocatellia bacterium]|nr:DUF2231 domain-containing protein [Blastocatellia bacterium]